MSAARSVAVIPARGGSKGIAHKNLREVGGVSLVERAVRSCRAVPAIDLVVVSTDDDEIAAQSQRAGARVVRRPTAIAGDTATSESAVLHALDELAAEGVVPEVTVLVQATSPFIDCMALDRAVRRVLEDEADAVLAATPTHAFTWRVVDGRAEAVGHDASSRPRRQDREPLYRETGAFYALRTSGLREWAHRFFGRIALELVPESHSMEIDTPADLDIARGLAASVVGGPIDVDAVVTDFDGVHTDDHVLVAQSGSESVRVLRGDGLGVADLKRAGVPLLILSSETSAVVAVRAAKLGVEVIQASDDKAAALSEWIAGRQLDPARIAFVGNDMNDLPGLSLVGWPIAVADARPEIRRVARVVLAHRGGEGAVREVADRVLLAHGGGRPSR